ncbi:hypothetical protein CCUS01_08045 [Colletotrichum cuscutae]|uniref:Uncharacterized protein n=1 Tax=Colletotrichum cuscutae TaxID=1209917 RepID=A0AAI9UTI2_9PEZI|nr:hypothetical protein CCUS01_08045 [Colletotrichum cuscutae]
MERQKMITVKTGIEDAVGLSDPMVFIQGGTDMVGSVSLKGPFQDPASLGPYAGQRPNGLTTRWVGIDSPGRCYLTVRLRLDAGVFFKCGATSFQKHISLASADSNATGFRCFLLSLDPDDLQRGGVEVFDGLDPISKLIVLHSGRPKMSSLRKPTRPRWYRPGRLALQAWIPAMSHLIEQLPAHLAISGTPLPTQTHSGCLRKGIQA